MSRREVSVNSTADFVVVERSVMNVLAMDVFRHASLLAAIARKGQCFSTRGKSTVVGGAVRAAREASTTRELSARFTPVIART